MTRIEERLWSGMEDDPLRRRIIDSSPESFLEGFYSVPEEVPAALEYAVLWTESDNTTLSYAMGRNLGALLAARNYYVKSSEGIKNE